MHKNKILLILFFLTCSLAIADQKPSKPRGNQVVIMMKVGIDSGLDETFFTNLLKIQPDQIQKPHTLQFLGEKKELAAKKDRGGLLGNFFYITMKKNKENTLSLNGVEVHLFDDERTAFTLPINAKLVIPSDKAVSYVYAGTFIYNIKQPYFSVAETSSIDEFDDAQAQLNLALGYEVQLYRGVINPIEPAK